MKGSLIKNATSGITVELPSGEKLPAGSIVEALDMVDRFKSACTCPSGDGSLRWPCPTHQSRDPRTVEGPDVAFETEKHLYIAPEVTSA